MVSNLIWGPGLRLGSWRAKEKRIEKEVRRERLLVDRNIRLAEARLAICRFHSAEYLVAQQSPLSPQRDDAIPHRPEFQQNPADPTSISSSEAQQINEGLPPAERTAPLKL